jgi:hypothetical protein
METNLSLAKELLRVHCPKCFKLYSVNPAQIKNSRPEFRCPSCLTHFWFSYDDAVKHKEVVGFVSYQASRGSVEPMMTTAGVEPQTAPSTSELRDQTQVNVDKVFKQSPSRNFKFQDGQAKDCPNCNKKVGLTATECMSCGIVFAKFKKEADEPNVPPTSADMKTMWEQVLEKYEDVELHNKFLQMGMAETNLAYCSSKYQTILNANPNDDIALAMKRKIIGTVESQMLPHPAPKTRKRKINPWNFVILGGTFLVVLGFAVPSMRNIVGVGASMIFLAVAFRAYSNQLNS